MDIYSGIKMKTLVGFEPTTIGKCRHFRSSLTVPSQRRIVKSMSQSMIRVIPGQSLIIARRGGTLVLMMKSKCSKARNVTYWHAHRFENWMTIRAKYTIQNHFKHTRQQPEPTSKLLAAGIVPIPHFVRPLPCPWKRECLPVSDATFTDKYQDVAMRRQNTP